MAIEKPYKCIATFRGFGKVLTQKYFYPWNGKDLRVEICNLSVLKAWVGLFLVKIDMLSCWLNFSNTQQCIDTIYILWLEVYLVIKKKVATFWKTAHVKRLAPPSKHLGPKGATLRHQVSRPFKLHNKLLT